MSSVVIATVLPFFFAEASPATAFPGSSGVSRIGSFVEFSQQALIPLVVPKLGSYALGYKVIVILDKHKQWKVFKQWKPWQCNAMQKEANKKRSQKALVY
ncbi:hypothetical protein Tco_0344024 [Tanacetum coccineum]